MTEKIKILNEHQIQHVIDVALCSACFEIQKRINQTDGGIAGVFFTGECRDRFDTLMRQYIELEFAMAEED